VGVTNEYSAGAQYALLEIESGSWKVIHKNVPYDLEKTMKRFQQSNYLELAGPMGRLVIRGMATRTNHMGPFLSWHSTYGSGQSLADAVDTFLKLY
jgi:hypothetical protein